MGNGQSATDFRTRLALSPKNGLSMDVKINRVDDERISITLIGAGHEFDEVFSEDFAKDLAVEFMKGLQIVQDASDNS
jgi:hypothetical protein